MVSVLIVNWNGRALLERHLPRVLATRYPSFEVIVVDNGSEDGSAAMVRSKFPEVRLLVLNENRGFAGGNVAALAVARGEFIATLNNDAWPEPDWLDHLVRVARSNPRVGIVAALLVRPNGTVDSAGDEFLSTGMVRKRQDRAAGTEAFSACAGAALYRRETLDDVGFFESRFFLVFEDVDLSFRARLAGWKVCFCSEARVHHEVGATMQKVPEVHAYHYERNVEWVWMRNLPGRLVVQFAAPLSAQRVWEAWVAFQKYGRHRFLRCWLGGKWDALRALPWVWRTRRRIQRARRVPPDEIARAITQVPEWWKPAYWAEQLRRGLRWRPPRKDR
jgi:GT2 family glycosyltransferase